MAEEGEVEVTRPHMESEALALNSDMVDMLSLLNYEKEFCDKEQPPMSTVYFVYQASNQAQQFKYFHTLLQWVLEKVGIAPQWQKYDAAAGICTHVQVALEKAGIKETFAPAKLKQGNGVEVCRALHGVLKKVFDKQQEQGEWKWGPPEWPDEPMFEEQDGESDAEANQSVDGSVNIGDDDDDVMYAEQAPTRVEKDQEDWQMLESSIDPREWALELERVTPQLRGIRVTTDTNEWREHVENTKKYGEVLTEALPEASGQLAALGADLANILQRVRTKESYINSQFDTRNDNYGNRKREIKEVTDKQNGLNEGHMVLVEELRSLTDEYETTKGEMAERSQTCQDTAPLVKIKDAKKRMQEDIRQMDLRIGVVNHTLMQAKLRHRPADATPSKGIWDEED